ncbi:uncharacterized protein LOC127813520 isoform X2 [Diospyros lotus]|uniref:uncharacterized protein LOC127813520 isoform X2 n=1 Tax=Diospyros lotus TaxID=55363 RepID=UPI00225523B6|nr:uncharacterized protein LOC127813520 isoform X2 [Diospyros lotus]
METESESLVVSETNPNHPPGRHRNFEVEEEGGREWNGESKANATPFDQKELLRALEVVERDSTAIAQSFTSLFASLRLALSEVTGSSVNHMQCFNDAAGQVQECALDAATKGNRYINSCLRLNEEMKGIDSLATQLYPCCLLHGATVDSIARCDCS